MGLISFLSSAAVRWGLGELFAFLKERQSHKRELELMQLQHSIQKEQAESQRAAAREAAEAGVKLVELQQAGAMRAAADAAFLATIENTGKASGVKAIDAWNAAIRPGLATVAILMLALQAVAPGAVTLTALHMEVFSSILGVFVGGRIQTTGR